MELPSKTSLAGIFAGAIVTLASFFGVAGADPTEQKTPDTLEPENPTEQTGVMGDPERRTPPTAKPNIEPTWLQIFLEA